MSPRILKGPNTSGPLETSAHRVGLWLIGMFPCTSNIISKASKTRQKTFLKCP